MDRAIKKRKLPLGWVVGPLAGAGLICAFVYQVRVVDKRPIQTANKAEIQFATATSGEFQEYFQANGYVVSAKTMFINSQEYGIVKKVYVEGGDIVTKGQVLVELQNDELESERALKQASLESAERDLADNAVRVQELQVRNSDQLLELDHQIDDATADFDAKTALAAFGDISKSEMERSRRELAFLRDRRDLLQKTQDLDVTLLEEEGAKTTSSIDIMKLDLQRLDERIRTLTIPSPAYGQITTFDASVGEVKNVGSRIAQLDIMDNLKMRASLDQYYLPKIRVGNKGTFEYQSGTDEKSTCTVAISWISPDVKSNTFDVDFTFDDPPRGMKIGQQFLVRVEIGEKHQAVMVPQGPFYQTTGGGWIYVADPSGNTASKRRIVVGKTNPDYLEILQGLKAGEMVVISDYGGFSDLDTIRLR